VDIIEEDMFDNAQMLCINSEKCTACGACVNVCSQQAISIENAIAVIARARCALCGDCVTVCPTSAIRIAEPVHAMVGKGGDVMRGRGWFGRGYRGWGRGRSNPYSFCRFYPWLPRRWWAYGMGPYPQATPDYYTPYMPHGWR